MLDGLEAPGWYAPHYVSTVRAALRLVTSMVRRAASPQVSLKEDSEAKSDSGSGSGGSSVGDEDPSEKKSNSSSRYSAAGVGCRECRIDVAGSDACRLPEYYGSQFVQIVHCRVNSAFGRGYKVSDCKGPRSDFSSQFVYVARKSKQRQESNRFNRFLAGRVSRNLRRRAQRRRVNRIDSRSVNNHQSWELLDFHELCTN